MTTEESPRTIDLAHEPPFRLGGHEVRPARREIVAGSERRILEPRVMQVLVALTRQKGEVVSRDDLIALCWGGRVVSEDSIDRCIGAIRRLAAEVGGFSVATIVRVGYRLSELTAGGGETPSTAAGGRRRSSRWLWALAAAASAVLIVATVASWLLLHRASRTQAFSDVRVAVLPFDTLSVGQEPRYFADSLRDEILSVLSRNQVQVVSRQESLALRGSNNREAVRRLKVGLLLDGTVERIGDSLRVRVHLDDAQDHTTLWSRVFEGPANEPDVVQTRVAGRATDVMSWLLSDRYGLGAPIDRGTLAAYLEAGDEIQNQGGDRFLPIFRQVVARAPDFSYGRSGLGFALARTAISGPPADRPRLLAEMKNEAERALTLDPHNGEAYILLTLATAPRAWDERERLLSTGLALDPTSPTVPGAYGTLLADLGRGQEALAMQRRAVAAEPYWARGHALLARRLVQQGQVEQGRAEIAQAARLWPDDADVVATQFQLAIESAPAAVALSLLDSPRTGPLAARPAAAEVWRAVLHARDRRDGGLRATARRDIARAADLGQIDRPAAVAVLSLLGDVDSAFTQAEHLDPVPGQGQPYGYDDTTSVLFAPVTRAMRQDRRFMPLVARLRLLDHWRASGKWPDFCQDPDLPYDCRAQAARLPGPPRR